MNKFKKGDRVVLKDTSGVSIFYHNTGNVLKKISEGSTGRVSCTYDGYVHVIFDGDTEVSQRLVEERFILEEVEIVSQKFKKVFYPCKHDYQELEDLIQLEGN